MPRHKAVNKATGETVYFDWNEKTPPTRRDVERISDEQRSSRLAALESVKANEVRTNPEWIEKGADWLGLNQPWLVPPAKPDTPWYKVADFNEPSPFMEAGRKLVAGAKQMWSGTPDQPGQAHPRIAATNKIVQGLMGTVGPPLTAAGYATGLGSAALGVRAALRGLLPVASGFVAGTGASKFTEANLEDAPWSSETKELISTISGLGVGGIVGGGVKRGLAPKPPSQTTGSVKPANAQPTVNPPKARRTKAPVANPQAVTPPVTQAPIGPQLPSIVDSLFDSDVVEATPTPPPPVATPIAPPADPPLESINRQPGFRTRGAIPQDVMPRPTAAYGPRIPPRPVELPPVPPPEVPTDLVSAARPEPLGLSEAPTVSSPNERTLPPAPIGPRPLAPQIPPQTPAPMGELPIQPRLPGPPPLEGQLPNVNPPEAMAPPISMGPRPAMPPVAPPEPVATPIQPQLPKVPVLEGQLPEPLPPEPIVPELRGNRPAPITEPAPPKPTEIAAPVPPPDAGPGRWTKGSGDIAAMLDNNRASIISGKKGYYIADASGGRKLSKAFSTPLSAMQAAEKMFPPLAETSIPSKVSPPPVEPPSTTLPTETTTPTPQPAAEIPPVEAPKAAQPIPDVAPLGEAPRTAEQIANKRYNDVLEFMKRRRDVTIPQIQTQFGIPGDTVRELLSSMRKRNVIEGDKKGRYNYRALPKEELPPADTTPIAGTPKATEITGPRGDRIKALRESLEGADEDSRKFTEGLISAQEKQAKLEAGTKSQKELASRIDEVESQIDKFEESGENPPELAGLYRELTKLEKKRDVEIIPAEERFGPRVANQRGAHGEAGLLGIPGKDIHKYVSDKAKAKFKVKSSKDLTPEQWIELTEDIKTERLEKEAKIKDLEDKEMEGEATPEEKRTLRKLLEDETGSSTILDSMKFIAGKLSSKGPNKGGFRKGYTQSGETTLIKAGARHLAEGIRAMRTEGEKIAGQLTSDYNKALKGVSDADFAEVLKIIQGKGTSRDPRILQLATDEVRRINSVQSKLGGARLDLDPFTSKRTDRALLSDFYNQAGVRAAEFSAYGRRVGASKGQAGIPIDIQKELIRMKRAGKDNASAYMVVDAYFNPSKLEGAQQAAWDAFSNVEIATKLGLATISNFTQPANVALIAGNITTMKAAAKMIRKYAASKEFSTEAGSTLSSLTHETQLSSGVAPTSFAGKMLELNGFSPTEVNNRILASLAGAEHAINMFKELKKNPNSKYAQRHLSHWLGLDPQQLLTQQKLTMDQIKTAAHTLSDRTQFRTTPLELPPHWKTTLSSRILTLFKSYAFNQSKFIKEGLLKELAAGNVRPILPLIFTIPILGTLADRTKRFATGRDQPEEFWDTVIGAYSSVGGVGIVQDIAMRSMAGGFAEWVGGPGVGDLAEGIENALKDKRQFEAKRAKTRAKAGTHTKRFLTKQIPLVGRPLAGYMYPYEKTKR